MTIKAKWLYKRQTETIKQIAEKEWYMIVKGKWMLKVDLSRINLLLKTTPLIGYETLLVQLKKIVPVSAEKVMSISRRFHGDFMFYILRETPFLLATVPCQNRFYCASYLHINSSSFVSSCQAFCIKTFWPTFPLLRF